MSYLRAAKHTWGMLNPWRPMLRDEAGQKVPLYRLDTRWRRPGDRLELPPEVFARVRTRLLSVTRLGMGARPLFLCTIVVFYAAFLCWIMSMARAPKIIAWQCLFMIGLFSWSAATYRFRIPKVHRETIAGALLAEHRCASCAYDLSTTSRDSRSRVQCPECGAVWVIPTRDPA